MSISTQALALIGDEGSADIHLGGAAALTADVDAGFGFGYADALKIEVFDGGVSAFSIGRKL